MSRILSKLRPASVYLFIGNGQTLQYEDMEAVKTVLAATLDPILPKVGHNKACNSLWAYIFVECSF